MIVFSFLVISDLQFLQLAEIERQHADADVELSIVCVRHDVITMVSGVNPLLALALDQRTVKASFH